MIHCSSCEKLEPVLSLLLLTEVVSCSCFGVIAIFTRYCRVKIALRLSVELNEMQTCWYVM